MSASCKAVRLIARPLLTRRAAGANRLCSRSVHTLRPTPAAHQSSSSSTVRSALVAAVILACGAVTLSQSGVVSAKEKSAPAQQSATAQQKPKADHNDEMVPDEGLEERNKTGQP